MTRAKGRWFAVSVGLILGLAAAAGGVARHSGSRERPAASAAAVDPDGQIAAAFEAARSAHRDLGYGDLLKELKVATTSPAPLSFDPTGVRYFKEIRAALDLTPEELGIFKHRGIAGVDPVQRTSMAGAYLAIYQRDLPVLITTDSILNAMHRSFDVALMELESQVFLPAMKKILAALYARLQDDIRATRAGDAKTRQSLSDVAMYLNVARHLLAGTLAEGDCRVDKWGCRSSSGVPTQDAPPVEASLDRPENAKAAEVVRAILAAKVDPGVSLYGRPVSPRPTIDWTQFKPRGHYTASAELSRYFRTMMWLGRVDVGFRLGESPLFGGADVERELRDAALLALLVQRAGQAEELSRIDGIIGFMVGLSDNVSAPALAAAVERAGAGGPADLSSQGALARLRTELGKTAAGGAQQIRSQLGYRAADGAAETPLPEVFQLFGQRFVIDSFVMAKVVYDAIEYQGQRPERPMPSGLDVMAALGNDEAVTLLQPELNAWHYGANLLAARRVVGDRTRAAADATAYDAWLGALAQLDDVPAAPTFPEVMRSQAWARKQLQTQLASWAELRHDTILYAKQSYTMGVLCEYPQGYVEPYPGFFARVARFGEMAAERLSGMKVPPYVQAPAFFAKFAAIVRKLERLARKELAAEPFDATDTAFIKDTIHLTSHGSGCGGPTFVYSGWYADLIYRGKVDAWEPTIADVHTDEARVLEVGVGDTNFLVAAIDNRGDRAAYVGPVYSYYEFEAPERLTDEEWRRRISEGKLPPRPAWLGAFQAAAKLRPMAPPRPTPEPNPNRARRAAPR